MFDLKRLGAGLSVAALSMALAGCGVEGGAPNTETAGAVGTSVEGTVSSPPEPVSRLTGAQRNAVRSARQYLEISGFSRDGLIEQLSSSYGDGYERADATVAVDSLNADWNDNAARSARQYLSISGFSCRGLIEQLSSEYGDKYTVSQATYGAQQAGAC
ncbi:MULTISPECIES: Ltp family lipoprotein [unclassified Brevundimonas]|uniref:Ltp family lipoprotein n=1 Tax=unclassified Brevundimonas TaxID=2622653 RepID=UPI0025C49D13|nr:MULTISPECIES: Ltp family lipoprotein [unclassified Brevundimonas]